MLAGLRRKLVSNARNGGQRVRFMATEKELKMRIASVTSIQKITKASKMVAAAKMRGVQNMLDIGRPFTLATKNIWKTKAQIEEEEKASDPKKEAPTQFDLESDSLIVPITSDRGLCGGINSSIAKVVRNSLQDSNAENVKILVLGERGRAMLHRHYGNKFSMAIVDASKMVVPTFGQAMAVANIYLEHKFSDSIVIWNKFNSAVSFKTIVTRLPSFEKRMENLESFAEYEIEGNENELLQNLAEFTAATEMYHFFLEGNTTEQAQKMAAMENSTKNAGELIQKLSVQYNRSRQARITTELIEIISGAASLE